MAPAPPAAPVFPCSQLLRFIHPASLPGFAAGVTMSKLNAYAASQNGNTMHFPHPRVGEPPPAINGNQTTGPSKFAPTPDFSRKWHSR